MSKADRIFWIADQVNGFVEWYIQTREGKIGPFKSQEESNIELMRQIKSWGCLTNVSLTDFVQPLINGHITLSPLQDTESQNQLLNGKKTISSNEPLIIRYMLELEQKKL